MGSPPVFVKKRGFTLLELLLVVGLIAVVASASSPLLMRFFYQNQFEVSMDKLNSTIYKAQEYAVANKDGVSWGICLYNNKIRLFSVSCATPTTKEDFAYPANVSIVNLNTVTFSPFRGEPSASLSITVTGPNNSEIVEINDVGGLSYY